MADLTFSEQALATLALLETCSKCGHPMHEHMHTGELIPEALVPIAHDVSGAKRVRSRDWQGCWHRVLVTRDFNCTCERTRA